MISGTANDKSKNKKSSELAELEPSAIMKVLQTLTAKVDKLTTSMHRIMSKQYPEEAFLLRPDGMPDLPLRKEKHFDQFELYLEDPSNFSKVVSMS